MKVVPISAAKKFDKKQRGQLRLELLEDRRLLATLPELVALSESSTLYSPLNEIPQSQSEAVSYIAPTSAVPFAVELGDLRTVLASAPLEFTAADENPLEFSIPKPDGSLARFAVVEAPVMHPDLAAKYPEIKTYRGQGIDSPADTVRFDVTPQGFHAQVLSPDGAYYVDPYYHLDTSVYVSYSGDDYAVTDQTNQLRENYREIGIAEGDVLVTDNGSFNIGETGDLTAIENGERFEIYAPDSYVINSDGTLSVSDDSGTVIYAASAFHLHNDGTVHVRAGADPESAGGGCPGCGGLGCANCGPTPEVASQDIQVHAFADAADSFEAAPMGEDADGGDIALRTGTMLRTYRLANATTVEYTNFHGGTNASGMAAVVTAVNRVTGVYEVELTIRMELVPNNDQLIFTNATGDSYTNNNGGAMLGQNQAVIDSTIGSANYDIGHVFSTGGGGVAGLGVVGINGQKARGVTGLGAPVGDPFYIDYVAHEMGHQYGGSHTFNGDSGSCSGQRSSSSAYEPGSGSTIQAYAGICGNDNIQSFSDPYFHSRSLDQMLNFVDSGIPNVGTRTATGNSEPVADAGPNYEIPANTPFMLTGSGTDPDGDALTYNWEQRDLGPQADVLAPDNGSSPLVRSRLATMSPTRVFPTESNLVNNQYNLRGERLPTVARRMDFRLTVRDNASGGGGVDTDNMWVDINNTGAPFRVTSQDNGSTWLGGDMQTITWDVAGTDSGQINTPNVDIILSDDGGFTYTIPLATGVPNNGSYTFTTPNIEISDARLMVKGSGNIFFDINDQDFAIIGTDTAPPMATSNVFDVNTGGGISTFIPVTYTDNVAVDASDIGPGDIEVVAPDGSILPAPYASRSSNIDGSPITGNYSVFAPGGSWDSADNGTYMVRFLAGEVTDTLENGTLVDQIIETFEVNVPPPPGDFNLDGALDCADIDMLTMAVASGMNDPAFDVTGEGVLNYNDVVVWVESIKGTLLGDADLDFTVDGGDFLTWNAFKFTSGTAWCSGDFNADGDTDGADFLIWNDNKFQSADEVVVLRPSSDTSSLRTDVAASVEHDVEVTKATALRAAPFALRVTASSVSTNRLRETDETEEHNVESKLASLDQVIESVYGPESI